MKSNPENFTATSNENSAFPPFTKRQKTISDTTDVDHQEEENKSCFSLKQSKQTPATNIQTFVAQCAECQNWRLISSKKKYEEIREHILEEPFVCEKAHEWNPDVTCDDPSDVSQEDNTKLWAIDKPGIPQAPQGWERFIKIRSEGKTQFADVHYKPPTGSILRSFKDVEKYLKDHANTVAQGVKVSQFSFEIPAPLQKDYVIKRSQKNQSDASHTGTTKLLQPEEEQSIDLAAASAMMLLDPVRPINRAAALAQGDLGVGDNNEDQPEVVQSEDLQEPEPTNPDSTPHAKAV